MSHKAKRTKTVKEKRVLYQGVPGCYSEEAAKDYFRESKNVTYTPADSFSEVFSRIQNEEADYAIVPIEDSCGGIFHQVYSALSSTDGTIAGEIVKQTKHAIMVASPETTLGSVKKVITSQQFMKQCDDYIKKHLAKVDLSAVFDAVEACNDLSKSKDPNVAVIGPPSVAKKLGLHILENENVVEAFMTRYVVFAPLAVHPQGQPQSGVSKCSLVIALRNEKMALFRLAAAFATREMDVLKIEARPASESLQLFTAHSLVPRPFDYVFYVDFIPVNNGKLSAAENMKAAVDNLNEFAVNIKVLGVYPISNIPDLADHIFSFSA